MAKKRNARHYDEPQYHADHPRPVTRRQFVAQGFMSGAAYTSGAGILSLFSNPREAAAALSPDLDALLTNPCQIATNGADIPLAIAGMEDQKHFYDAIHAEVGQLDFDAVEAEVVGVTQDLIAREENIKAILFECTDLPPYAAATQEAVGLPVFDFTTMINYVYSGLVRKRFEGFC